MNTRTVVSLFCLLQPVTLVACGGADDLAPADPGAKSSSSSAGKSGSDSAASGKGGSDATSDETGGASAGSGGSSSTAPATTGAGTPDTVGTVTGAAPSASGTEYTFATGHFSVSPGAEVYKCQDFTNPFGKDIGIVQEVTSLTAGSHHMFAFVLPNGQLTLKDNLVDCPGGGVEFHDYLTTSGTPVATTTYPPSTGRIFSQSNGLRLMVHFINTGTDSKDAFVNYKVVYVEPSGLTNKVASIFLDQVGLSVPPGMSTASKTYSLTQDINLMGDASHMHSRGVHFVASTDSGQTLYDGTEWQEPQPKSFDPPLALKSGTKITWACTYNNTTGQTLTFGESASSNEMCIFPGEFYNSTGQQISYQALF
ncbi:MAG TPA: hypothetical protein VH062_36245 [Polyangiaceae bacterium]|jgi:hypothetical protein|nr:hypothetical protein [Polyangiaceae bacterium]